MNQILGGCFPHARPPFPASDLGPSPRMGPASGKTTAGLFCRTIFLSQRLFWAPPLSHLSAGSCSLAWSSGASSPSEHAAVPPPAGASMGCDPRQSFGVSWVGTGPGRHPQDAYRAGPFLGLSARDGAGSRHLCALTRCVPEGVRRELGQGASVPVAAC